MHKEMFVVTLPAIDLLITTWHIAALRVLTDDNFCSIVNAVAWKLEFCCDLTKLGNCNHFLLTDHL